jgi:hypothetical protein
MSVATLPPRPSPDALPQRLQTLLEHLTHRELAGRLEQVYRAAAVAIDRLSHLSIVRYEPKTVEEVGAADLSLWETMAPAIGETVKDVNSLVAVIRKVFPQQAKQPEAQGWQPPPASMDERLAREVEVVLHASAERLARRVADLGQRVRRPEVVSDRWALMAELQSFRTDFRTQIGDLVYLTASAFADVQREQVVPGYQLQVAAAAAFRGALADLRRSLRSRLDRVSTAMAEELPTLAKRLEETLMAFAALPASMTMKTRDKRQLIELRERLGTMARRPDVKAGELKEALEPFLQEAERMGTEVTQALLSVHDRAIWVASGARLEQATMHLFLNSPGAERVLREAVKAAEALYGRTPALDGFLRKVRAAPEESFNEPALRETLELFRERLAGLPFS